MSANSLHKPFCAESYSLHRKLSGAFLLCAKLSATVECKTMFDRVYNNYKF